MPDHEGPDEHITIGRAAQISGLAPNTISVQAQVGNCMIAVKGGGAAHRSARP
jgi:hypothetical protein